MSESYSENNCCLLLSVYEVIAAFEGEEFFPLSLSLLLYFSHTKLRRSMFSWQRVKRVHKSRGNIRQREKEGEREKELLGQSGCLYLDIK